MDIKKISEVDYNRIKSELMGIVNSKSDMDISDTIKVAAIMYFIKKYKANTFEELIESNSIDDAIVDILTKVSSSFINEIYRIISMYSEEEILSYILFEDTSHLGMRSISSTPYCLLELSNRLLDIQKSDRVLELCSGYGSFMVNAFEHAEEFNYTGIDLNFNGNEITKIRSYILGVNANISIFDATEYKSEKKFDKVFSNYPFNIRRLTSDDNDIVINGQKYSDILSRTISSDWLFNISTINNLKDDGKAVAIMSNGGTWNSVDMQVRRIFIEQGLVEAIIAMPERLFYDTGIPTTLLVLSKNNKVVRLIDASKEYVSERRMNILSVNNINNIIEMLSKDTNISKSITNEELKENEYYFSPTRYLNKLPELKNGVRLKELVMNINRGSQIKASDLEHYKTDKITDIKYLQLTNIKNSIISYDDDEQFLDSIPEGNERYIIRDKTIVLAKIGSPYFKSAVVEVRDDEHILPNGNLFTIEVNTELIDPYYLQAFLDSELGQATLRSIMSGGVMKTISQSKLLEINVPVIDLSLQKEIANKYASNLDEIKYLERKLQRTIDKSKKIFNQGE